MFIDEDPQRHRRLDRVESTQTFLQHSDLPPGSVVLAREQTAGRGTGGRDWFSAPGRSFIFSALLSSPAIRLDRLSYIPLLTGLAVLEGARAALYKWGSGDSGEPVELGLKWPNDVLLRRSGRTGKLAGVLVETELGGGGQGDYRAIIGVGLNWFGLPAEMETTLEGSAAAALFETDPGRSPFEFAPDFIARLNTHLAGLTQAGTPGFLDEIRRHSWLTGRLVRIDGVIRRVRGIADSGALLAETPAGGLEEIVGRREPLEIVGD